MVEGARLESVYTGNCIEGSNPSLSARLSSNQGVLDLLFLKRSHRRVSSVWCQNSEAAHLHRQSGLRDRFFQILKSYAR